MVGNLLVALALLSGELDVQASATLEARAGEQPILAGNEPQPFIAAIATPTGMLEYREPGLALRLSYSPRVYWADPNVLGSERPLLLHTVDLVAIAQTTRRFYLQGDLTGSIGQPDYTELAVLLGSSQPNLPTQANLPSITEIATATGRVATRTILTRLWELDLDGRLFYWKALDTAPNALTITEQKSATEQGTALFALTPRNALGFGAAASQASYSTGLDVYTIGPTVSWKVHLTRLDDLRLVLGMEYVRAAGPTPPGLPPLLGPSGQTVSPIGGVELVSRVERQDDTIILASIAAGVDYYIDPVAEIASPRGEASGGVTAIMLPDWQATVRGDFATALRATPLPPISGSVPDETVVSLTASVQRRISPGFFAEIGGTWVERGPAFVTPDFQFNQRQIFVFARLSWTSHPLPRPIY